MLDDEPAPRAVRRALHSVPRVLRLINGLPVVHVDRRRVSVANRHAADVGSRVEVGLQQHRREGLHVSDVVEVRAHLVEREPISRVDAQIEEVEYGVFELATIQALEGPTPRVRAPLCRSVERALEHLDELEQCVPLGRPRTRRRHHARAELADHALDHFRVLRGGRDVELLQGQIAAEARVRVASHAGVGHDFVGIDFRRERSLVQTGSDRHVVGRQVDRLACEHQCQAQHAGADDD